ncbi:MAG: Gfo/Idh/MocA family oxidoreductase [Chloroflexota bacterium]
MIRVGLIGAGMVGNAHANAYARLPNAQVVAVADGRADRAQAMAECFEAQAFSTMAELLAGTQVDMIDICLPTPRHAEHTVAALAAGKHVLCEKPIARTLEDAQRMIDAAKEARDRFGSKFMVGQVVRFFPEYARAHDLLRQGVIGQSKVARTLRGGIFPAWSADNWLGDFAQSGGVVLDTACHEFDWLRWCFGEVVRVFARGLVYETLAQGQPRDHGLILLRFQSGMIAHVEVTWALPPGGPFMTKVEIAGTKGLMAFDNQTSMPIQGYWLGSDGSSNTIPESPVAVTPFQAEISHFLECIEQDREPLVSPEDALAALEISLAALESIESGQPVTLGGAR